MPSANAVFCVESATDYGLGIKTYTCT